MSSFVVKILSITLGLFFIFVGVLKLTPAVNKDLYTEMRKQYIRMSKVFPLVNQTGWKPNPHTYRKIIATSEITCGTVLTLLPNSGKLVWKGSRWLGKSIVQITDKGKYMYIGMMTVARVLLVKELEESVGTVKNLASVYMILLFINDVVSHTQIKNGLERMSLPIVFTLLLTCRLIIYYQELSREKNKADELENRKEKVTETTEKITEEKKTQ